MNAESRLPVGDLGSIDDLESSLIDSWRGVCRATHRFLELLREFDLRQGYEAYGNTDCAEWLNWRCGIARVTAQEKVRVARALWNLPQIDSAFAKGDLSYSKVRAITRIASDRNETELLDYALTVSASQLDAYCAQVRYGDPVDSQTAARRAREGRSLTRYFREDGTGVMTVELPRAELELVLHAIDRVASDLPADEDRSLFATAADALVAMAQDSLAGAGAQGSSAGDSHTMLVRVDAGALGGQGGRSDLPLPAVRRLCCDGSVIQVLESDSGDVLSVGRKQRTIPTAIRRALETRDGHCQFPGCTRERWLDGHHVQHWAEGGETSLENLILLCSHHHTLMHEGGFTLERRRDGSGYFVRPDGRPVEAQVREERASYRLDSSRDGDTSSAEDGPRSAEDGPRSAEDGLRCLTIAGSPVDPDRPGWHNRAFSTRPAWRSTCAGDDNGGYHAPGWLGQVL
jgi:hypothetical protein